MIWHPMVEGDPNIDENTMKMIDNVADKIEVQRLVSMGVLVKPSSFGTVEAAPLTAKYVRYLEEKDQGQRAYVDEEIKTGCKGSLTSWSRGRIALHLRVQASFIVFYLEWL